MSERGDWHPDSAEMRATALKHSTMLQSAELQRTTGYCYIPHCIACNENRSTWPDLGNPLENNVFLQLRNSLSSSGDCISCLCILGVYIYIYIYIFEYMYVCRYACIYVCMHGLMDGWMYACIHEGCMHVCMCAWIWIWIWIHKSLFGHYLIRSLKPPPPSLPQILLRQARTILPSLRNRTTKDGKNYIVFRGADQI